LFQKASLVFDTSMVRFTGPMLSINATDDNGNTSDQKTTVFSSQVIFDSTNILVNDSNVSFTAQHDYTAFENNETNAPHRYGFVQFNNTEVAMNSSRFLITGSNPRTVNRSLYDDLTYTNLFSSVGFSFTNITIDDSNTTFTTNSSSGTDESSLVFNHTKILYNRTEASMRHSETSVSDSSIFYGKNADVQWYGDSSSAYFSNGVDIVVDKSKVVFDDTHVELTGSSGKFISRVDSNFRGPDSSSNFIDFVVSRNVDVRFEQDPQMTIHSDVDFSGGHKITVDESGTLAIDGKLKSNDKAEFRGDVKMVNVDLHVEGHLDIDGSDGSNNAGIKFHDTVDVRFYNTLNLDRDLELAGHADMGSLHVSQEGVFGGHLDCHGGATVSVELLKVNGGLDVVSDATFENAAFDSIKASSGSVSEQLTAGTIKSESTLFAANLDVSGRASAGSLDVSSDAGIGGDLNVDGTFVQEAHVFQEMTVLGKATFGSLTASSAMISDTATVQNLLVGFDATVGGDLNVGGTTALEVTMFTDIAVLGEAKVGSLSASSALISGAARVQELTVDADASVQSLLVANEADVGGDLNVGGTTTLEATVYTDILVLGEAKVGSLSASSASIGGAATIKELTVNTNAEVGGSLTARGPFAATANTAASFADVSIGGKAVVNLLEATETSVGKLLAVAGNTSLAGDLHVGGAFAPQNSRFESIEVSGTATVGSLRATSSSSVGGSLTAGTLVVDGSADIDGDLSVGGALQDSVFEDITVLGTASIASLSATTASVTDKATLHSLSVASDAYIAGNLNVDGTVTYDDVLFTDITVIGEAKFDELTARSATVSGSASFQTLGVSGTAEVLGDLSIGGTLGTAFLDCQQDAVVSGTASVASLLATTASVDDAASIARLSVGTDAEIGGDLTVLGAIVN